MDARRFCAGLLVVVAFGAAGCSDRGPAPTSPAPPSASARAPVPTSTPAPLGAQAAVDRLFAAGVAGDRAVWDAGTAASDG
ncbi:MAG: hypothetical protein ACRYG2_25685, partial [Janthinobacterium lividum]